HGHTDCRSQSRKESWIMVFRSWRNWLHGRSPRTGRGRPGGQQTRPQVELLEDRTLLDASFAAPINTAVGNNPKAVAFGDFNGDGKLDAVVTNFNDNTVSVLLGNGNGSFTPAPGAPLPTGGTGPDGVAVGDFTGNGKL